MFGVIFAAIGAACLALAMSVQRYGLKTAPPVPFLCGYGLPQFWVWFSGLLIYWVANGLFAVSLIYAPLALLGAIFTTLLVWNLLFGWWLLDEKITAVKSAGALLIMVGVSLIGIATPGDIPTEYSVQLVESFLNDPIGAAFLGTLIGVVVICVIIIAVFEKKYPLPDDTEDVTDVELEAPASGTPTDPSALSGSTNPTFRSQVISEGNQSPGNLGHSTYRRRTTLTSTFKESVKSKNTVFFTSQLMRRNGLKSIAPPKDGFCEVSRQIQIEAIIEKNVNTPSWVDSLMGVVYPGSLGLDEGIGHLAMKSFMALLTTCGDSDECGAPILWGMIMIWLASSLGTLWWLQTVFRRYDVTQALPIEYGAVMACDALSAIVFYKENIYMKTWQLVMVLTGVGVIFLGIIVGRYKPASTTPPVVQVN